MRAITSKRTSNRHRRLQVERLETRWVLNGDPMVFDSNLQVDTVVSDLVTPTSLAFVGDGDFLVLEKNTGEVKRVQTGDEGVAVETVLDLAVNFASERGLLGIALDPDFGDNGFVYLFWTESTTGNDTNVLSETPLLGNRVDRFVWDGSELTHHENLIQIRAIQQDEDQPERGNHDGGVLRFGPDGMLYVFIGDLGRRGQLQNLEDGPFPPDDPRFGTDDQFGGPEPDDAHLAGVVLRLNPDGTAPEDNPFFDVGAALGGEVGANLQKVFSYGHRNSFGMAFDPVAGSLWLQENGDDSFSELNRVEAGMNGGWVQIMGPVERIAEFKEIETSDEFFGLQQVRWSPENIAETPEDALDNLFVLPGSHYSDPQFSWKFEVSPAGIGFLESRALGPQYENDLFVGAARPFLEGGYLFRFDLIGNRQKVAVDDPRLEDRVADNLDKHNITESESLLFGRNFGVATDIQTGPDGNLYVVSLSNGAIYQISRTTPFPGQEPRGRGRPAQAPQGGHVEENDVSSVRTFGTRLTGQEETIPVDTRAQGQAIFRLSKDGTELHFTLVATNIQNAFAAHIHLGPTGEDGPVVATLFSAEPGGGRTSGLLARGTITADDLQGPLAGQPLSALIDAMLAGNTYVNVHTDDAMPGDNTGPGDMARGEIRGQIEPRGPLAPENVDELFTLRGRRRLSAADELLDELLPEDGAELGFALRSLRAHPWRASRR